MFIDSINELPKEKRPTDKMIFDGSSEELEEWLEDVLSGKYEPAISINLNEVE